MSTLSALFAGAMQDLRGILGEYVRFNGKTYRVLTEMSISGDTGTAFLPHEGLGALAAAQEPRVFDFSAEDFTPYTADTPPIEGDHIEWMGLWFRITRDSPSNIDTDTDGLTVYGYRDLTYTPPDGNSIGVNSMAINFTTTRSASYGGLTTGGSSPLENVASAVPASVDVPANQTDYLLDFADITIAKVLHISIDTTADVTIKTNNATTPGQTIVLTPNTPVFWTVGDIASNPISTSTLTALYITTTAKATVKMLSAISRT